MQPRTKAKDRGQEIWFLLSESERTAGRVLDGLKAEGIRASKASVCRWANEWKAVVHKAVDLIELPAPTETTTTADLADIPAELRQVIPDRLLHVAKGRGLDRVEDAIGILSDGIAARAQQLVADENHKTLRTAVGALATMASAMERIVTSRATVSIAHRSYCEGDRLLAEAERHRAEAKKIDAETEALSGESRARNAREIPGTAYDHEVSISNTEEAMAALRGMTNREN